MWCRDPSVTKLLSVMALGVLVLVALLLGAWFYARYGIHPISDAEIMQRVESHKSLFYRLEQMLLEDRDLFVEADNSDARKRPAKIQAKRYNEYQKLLADTGAVRAESQGYRVKITMWSNFPWAFLTQQGTEKYLINTVPEQYLIDIDRRKSSISKEPPAQVQHGWTIEYRDERIDHFFGF